MVWEIIDCYQFVFLTCNDPADVFLEFIIVFGLNEILPSFDREHDVNINLRVRVGHAQKMPLLTELGIIFLPSAKMPALRASFGRIGERLQSGLLQEARVNRFFFDNRFVTRNGSRYSHAHP